MKLLSYLTSMVLLCCMGPSSGREPVANLEQRSNFAWAGFKDNRDRLQMGVFRAHGQLKINTEMNRVEGEVHIFSAFDFPQKLLRFDRAEPVPFKINPTKNARPLSQWGGKYARNRITVDISLPEDPFAVSFPLGKKAPPQLAVFDVRVVGLYDWLGVTRSFDYDDIYKHYSTRVPAEIEIQDNIYRLSIHQDAGGIPVRHEIWLDGNKGFSPIHFERRFRDAKSPDGKWSEPDCISESTWNQVDGVWVPSSWKLETLKKGTVQKGYYLTFEWEAINRPIEERLFSKEGFDLPKGTYLVDLRLQKPIVTEIVGGGPNYVLNAEATLPTHSWFFSTWVWLLRIALVVLLVAAVLIWWRRRVRITKTT